MKKQEISKKFRFYIVYWNPLNNPSRTINYPCFARNPQEAILKAKKTTRSKAKMYTNEISREQYINLNK